MAVHPGNAKLATVAERRILFIEDNYDDFELMEHQLSKYKEAGLVVEHSDCLAAALSRLRSGGIDIIFLDLSLPDSQGIDTVKKVRLAVPAIPIIILSGTADMDIALESLQYGAEDYLIKGSVDTVSIVRSINYALARHTAREANERLATIVEASDDAIIGKTLNGTITSWNKGASKLFGYSVDEATGQSIGMIIPPDATPKLDTILKTLENGDTIQNLETVRLNKNGDRIHVLATISPIVSTDGTISGAAAIDRDITERKRAEQDIADARLRLGLALDAAAIGVWDFDVLKNSVWRSLRHDEIFGNRELLPEWNFDIFTTYVLPEDIPLATEAIHAGLERGKFRMQCRIVRADDKAIRWISVRGETFWNEQGAPIRMMGTVIDVTEIKEKQEQQSLLAIMKEREDFMATLTHDMKNPLIGANRLLELFISGALGELTSQQSEMLRCLKESNAGLLKLIADLIDVYRLEKNVNDLLLADCDLVRTIASCVSLVVPFANLRSVKVITQLPETMVVRADKCRLERVVQNLLDNALKFAPDGGTVKIRLFSEDADTVLEIEDNGPGIAPDEQSRLFKRFSQGTAGKRYTGGSGLGLYLCKQIVEAHGGTIECNSQPNKATIFRVCLPSGIDEKTLEPAA